jgi:hypothetical protein
MEEGKKILDTNAQGWQSGNYLTPPGDPAVRNLQLAAELCHMRAEQ